MVDNVLVVVDEILVGFMVGLIDRVELIFIRFIFLISFKFVI